MELPEVSYMDGGHVKWYRILENSLAVSYKVIYTPTVDPAILLLGIYLSEMKTYVHTKTSI